MNRNYQVIDPNKLAKRKQFHWFNTFSNPCYFVNVKMDVTNLLEKSHSTNTSFFVNLIYIIGSELQKIEEFRYRIYKEEVRLYEVIHIGVAVATKSGMFENLDTEFIDDYDIFYKKTKNLVDEIKEREEVKETFNDDENFNYFYFSCVPWLNFDSINHALPNGNKESLTVPRVSWSKYYLDNEKYYLTLNICASHTFVDGEPMSRAFNNIQKALDLF